MHEESLRFLNAAFGSLTSEWYYLWTLGGRRSVWVQGQDRPSLDTDIDVYVGAGVANQPGNAKQRLTLTTVDGIIGLWADVDYAWEGKKKGKSNLPKDADAALRLIDAFPLRPSIIVDSGHGFQCWWLFHELWSFVSPAERDEAQSLAKRWSAALQAIAGSQGAILDSVFDLSRVLRLPGTFNAKDPEDIKPVFIHHIEDGLTYSVEDFQPYLLDLTEQPELPKIEVAQSEVDTSKHPDFQKFHALLDNDLNFRNLWFHAKKPAHDDSMSGYDLALANIAVKIGWSDEEILALLIQHRRHQKADLKHPRYYQLTILRARRQEGIEQIDTGGQADTKTGLVDSISSYLGAQFQSLIEYRSATPIYRLILDIGEVPLGTAATLVNQTSFRTKVLECTGQLPDPVKATRWTNIVNAMMKVRVVEDQGEEMMEQGRLIEWMSSYLRERRPAVTQIENNMAARLPFYKDGHIHIFTRPFSEWVRDHAPGEKISMNEISALLTRFRCENIVHHYIPAHLNARTSTTARALPIDLFPPAEYANPDE